MLSGTLTNIGFALLFLYSFMQIMNFYGVGLEYYFDYVLFYIFIMVTAIVLPHDYTSV
jgi:hypothetical protein